MRAKLVLLLIHPAVGSPGSVLITIGTLRSAQSHMGSPGTLGGHDVRQVDLGFEQVSEDAKTEGTAL